MHLPFQFLCCELDCEDLIKACFLEFCFTQFQFAISWADCQSTNLKHPHPKGLRVDEQSCWCEQGWVIRIAPPPPPNIGGETEGSFVFLWSMTQCLTLATFQARSSFIPWLFKPPQNCCKVASITYLLNISLLYPIYYAG